MLVPLAVLAAGCGTSAARESSSGDASRIDVVARSKPTTRIVGGTPVQRAVLRRILSSLGPTGVRSVEVADSDPDGVVFKARANGSDDRFALWEASVVGNVLRATVDRASSTPGRFHRGRRGRGSDVRAGPLGCAHEDASDLGRGKRRAPARRGDRQGAGGFGPGAPAATRSAGLRHRAAHERSGAIPPGWTRPHARACESRGLATSRWPVRESDG